MTLKGQMALVSRLLPAMVFLGIFAGLGFGFVSSVLLSIVDE